MTVTVTLNSQEVPARWSSCTPWQSNPQTVHVAVAGTRNGGVTFSKGSSSAVATLTGRMLWTAANQTVLDNLPGATVSVNNGLETRTGVVTGLTVREGTPAWIFFSITVTED